MLGEDSGRRAWLRNYDFMKTPRVLSQFTQSTLCYRTSLWTAGLWVKWIFFFSALLFAHDYPPPIWVSISWTASCFLHIFHELVIPKSLRAEIHYRGAFKAVTLIAPCFILFASTVIMDFYFCRSNPSKRVAHAVLLYEISLLLYCYLVNLAYRDYCLWRGLQTGRKKGSQPC